jgi:hypothetical protein
MGLLLVCRKRFIDPACALIIHAEGIASARVEGKSRFFNSFLLARAAQEIPWPMRGSFSEVRCALRNEIAVKYYLQVSVKQTMKAQAMMVRAIARKLPGLKPRLSY